MHFTDTRPLILTAELDAQNQSYLDGLRRRYFPPERNYLRAHLTMFHALPASEIQRVTALLVDTTIREHPIPGDLSGLRLLGNGVALSVRCPGLEKVRDEVALVFHDVLSAQDRQTWRPHITVQNKVGRESARELFERLQQEFEPRQLLITGLELWRYDGGPWEPVERFHFGMLTRPSTAAT